jgi:predicted transcriptional regulator
VTLYLAAYLLLPFSYFEKFVVSVRFLINRLRLKL